MIADNADKKTGKSLKEMCKSVGIHPSLYYRWVKECSVCYESYGKKKNSVSCATEKCDNIMCMSCFVRDFLRNLAVTNQYNFTLSIPCCACRVPGAFRIGVWSPTTKSPNFYSIMKDIAATSLIGVQTEFAKISGQLFRARKEMSGIINSSSEEPFSQADTDLIQKFCSFLKKYIGHRYSKSRWATEMKFTTRAF